MGLGYAASMGCFVNKVHCSHLCSSAHTEGLLLSVLRKHDPVQMWWLDFCSGIAQDAVVFRLVYGLHSNVINILTPQEGQVISQTSWEKLHCGAPFTLLNLTAFLPLPCTRGMPLKANRMPESHCLCVNWCLGGRQ